MTHHCRRLLAIACIAGLTLMVHEPAQAVIEPGPTELVSRSTSGLPGDAGSWEPLLSAHGRVVAFSSRASNLVPGDTNGVSDVFAKDLSDGTVVRVSVDGQGQQLAGGSRLRSMSANGRYMTFQHDELVEHPDGIRRQTSMLLWDRTQGTSRAISVRAHDGHRVRVADGVLSGNGRYLVFSSLERLVRHDRQGNLDVYRLDLSTGKVRRVSVAPLGHSRSRLSMAPSVSYGGRFVAFQTNARLVKRDRRQWDRDIYVRDMRKRRPQLVSVSSSGRQANSGNVNPAISAGGRYIVFSSMATNLIRRDTNRRWDVFLRDRRTGRTTRVSVNSRGRQANHHSQGMVYSGAAPSISRDGRFVTFGSLATNLDPDATHFTDPDGAGNVYLRDRRARTTESISMARDGTGADGFGGSGTVSADGSLLAFGSLASNLVEGDTNHDGDVFVRKLRTAPK